MCHNCWHHEVNTDVSYRKDELLNSTKRVTNTDSSRFPDNTDDIDALKRKVLKVNYIKK